MSKNTICDCGKNKDKRAKQCSFCARKSYSVEEPNLNDDLKSILIEQTKFCTSFLQVSYKVGFSRQTVSKWIRNLKLDISHFRPARNRSQSSEKIFTKTNKRKNATVKKRILEKKIIKYECFICKNTGNWLNKNLTLELDHIDGDCYNNNIINLRFLCPNCHSQTDTNKGKNNKKYNTT